MNKEQQDLAWQCLPKEYREEIRRLYKDGTKHNKINRIAIYKSLFGHHNLTSDTEPEEMLYINKEKFEGFYKFLEYVYSHDSSLYDDLYWKFVERLPDKEEQSNPNISATQAELDSATTNKSVDEIAEEIAEKCILPVREQLNIEQPIPKFSIGQKVVYTCNNGRKEVGEIAAYFPDEERFKYSVRFGKEYHNMAEHQLEPYTEENKETMEEKELNLAELLKGCDDEIFYNPLLGNVTVTPSIDGKLLHVHQGGFTVDIAPNGTDNDGNMALFPSKELRDWIEWKKSKNTKYRLNICWNINKMENEDDYNIEGYGHFHVECKTKEEADDAIESIKELVNEA